MDPETEGATKKEANGAFYPLSSFFCFSICFLLFMGMASVVVAVVWKKI